LQVSFITGALESMGRKELLSNFSIRRFVKLPLMLEIRAFDLANAIKFRISWCHIVRLYLVGDLRVSAVVIKGVSLKLSKRKNLYNSMQNCCKLPYNSNKYSPRDCVLCRTIHIRL